MSVRTSVVLPAPRSPESVTKSPAWSELAMSIASRRVGYSSGSATQKVDVPEGGRALACPDPPPRGHGPQASLPRFRGGGVEAGDPGGRGGAARGRVRG